MASRTIRIYKKYFTEFYVEQTEAVKRKINYCLNMVKTVDRVPSSILRNMEGADGLYEVRVEEVVIFPGYFVVLMKKPWFNSSFLFL